MEWGGDGVAGGMTSGSWGVGGMFGPASHAQPSSKMAIGENQAEGNSRVMGLGSKSQLFE